MIEFRHVSKQFGKLNALRDVNLHLNSGQCIALIGPNACGKTTLLKCLLGMVKPTTGEIFFKGQNIANDDQYRRMIGYMPQKGTYPDHMNIGQVFELIKRLRYTQNGVDDQLVRAFQLEAMFDKKMNTLSGGTTQKVSASLAFLFAPEVLVLDEPTAGLDPLAAEILKEKIIAERQKGKLILITSHLLSDLDELVTDVVIMEDGSIRYHQSIAELKQRTQTPTLAKAISHLLRTHDI
jgi:Cu-processing system ATP-binding protein